MLYAIWRAGDLKPRAACLLRVKCAYGYFGVDPGGKPDG